VRLRLEAVLLRWRLPELLVPRKDGLTPKVQHPFCDPRMLPEVLARSTWEAVSDRACRRCLLHVSGCSVRRIVGSDKLWPRMGLSPGSSLWWRSRYAGREPKPSRLVQSCISDTLPGQMVGSAITAVGDPYRSSSPVTVPRSPVLDFTDAVSGVRAGPVPNLRSVEGEAKDEMIGAACGVS